MEETPIKKQPAWIVKTSDLVYKLINFILLTIILGSLLGVIGNWIYSKIPLPDYLTFFINLLTNSIEAVLKQPAVLACIGIIIILLRLLADQHRRSEMPLPDKELELGYLNCMIKETEMHTLSGIPADLIPQSARLEEVFIPLLFRRNQPMIDDPLTQDEVNGETHLSENEKERLRREIRKSWHPTLEEDDKTISVAELLQSLTKDKPTAVIRGYPGGGKSTLLQALTLYMACYCLNRRWRRRLSDLLNNAHQPWRSRLSHLFKDPDQPLPLIKTPLIPIFVRLGDYANERAKDAKLTFSFYLERSLTRWNIPGVGKFLEKCLKNGRCLILFDGLNEVRYNREEVQNEIKNFISQYSHTIKQTFTFNRFLITTRIAGYNPNDFTDYLHYTIAELTNDQIKNCLHRWYEAIIRNHPTDHNRDKQKRRRDNLYSTITNNAKVCDLASRPLSLTLLVLMEQSNIGLPRGRVDLYRRVTSMLLQKYKDAQERPLIPKEKGIQYLGPLALWMLEHGKRWASSSEVKEKLRATIGVDKVSDNEISQKVEIILKQVREEGGLFVYRTEYDLGFSHLTFQEYFAARYMLNGIKEKRNRGIVELVGKVHLDDRLREAFLLAVAHQSYEDKRIANQIVAELIKHPGGTDIKSKAYDLCLAASCLIEVKPFSIDFKIQKETAEHLLAVYEYALQNCQFKICEDIGETMGKWLVSSQGNEPEMTPLCDVLRERANLTLLPLIVRPDESIKQPDSFWQVVFNIFISSSTKDGTLEGELQQLAETMCNGFFVTENSKCRNLFLDIVRKSTINKENQIKFVQILEEANKGSDNDKVRQGYKDTLLQACKDALKQVKS